MAFYGGSAAAGYGDAVKDESNRAVQSAEVLRLLQAVSQQGTTFQNAQQDRARAQDTRSGVGNLLYGLLPPTPGQTGPLPPAPGQPSLPPPPAPAAGPVGAPPGAPGPAGGPPAPPQGPSMANMAGGGGPAPAAPPQIPPYRAIPEPQPGPDGAPGSIPPPPAAAAAPAQMPKLPSPMAFLAKIKEAGVDPGKAADYLDAYAPMYQAQQAEEFKQMQAELKAQHAAIEAYKATLAQHKDARDERRLDQGDRKLDQQEANAERREDRADARERRLVGALAQRQANAAGAGGGAGKLSKQYEEDPEYKKKVDFWAKMITSGGTLPARFAQVVGKNFSGDVYSAAATNAGGEANDVLANKISMKQMTSEAQKLGTQSASVAIANKELQKFIPLAESAIDAVPRAGWKPINQLIQAGENTWSPEQKRLVIANRSVQNAYSQLIQRGAPTVHSLTEAEKLLSTADSPEVYKAAMSQLRAEGVAAEEGLVEAHSDLRKRVQGIGKDDKPKGAPVQTATNPKTGEKLELRDGKWVPAPK